MLIVRLIDECQVQMNLIVAAQVQEAIGAQFQTLNLLGLERRKNESEDNM